MASLDLKQDFCRICLRQNFTMRDWNDYVLEFCGITYKDCYYKYTQLEQLDPFSSSMLCEICSKDLKNAHLLMEKALQSYKILHGKLLDAAKSCDEVTTITPLVNLKSETEEFEKLYFEQSTDLIRGNEQISKEFADMPLTRRTKETIKVKRKRQACNEANTRRKGLSAQHASEEECQNSRNLSPSLLTPIDFLSEDGIDETIELKFEICDESDKEKVIFSEKFKSLRNGKRHSKNTINEQNEVSKAKYNEDTCNSPELQKFVTSNEDIDKIESKKKTGMICSYCSRILCGIASLKAHEETHKEHRERAVTCPICELKLFNKRNLNDHMKVHVEHREKKYKCEFCVKAYFNMGALNIHRRIHLGKMIPCPLCSKQFFRQIDLDKHMNSHSATPINADVKKRSRYFVYCKECDKSMLSSSWKAHEAVHKNQPLMKCSICTKEFFCRKACVTHMKKIHNKTTREEYDQFIIACTKSRLSRLMLEQQKKIKQIP